MKKILLILILLIMVLAVLLICRNRGEDQADGFIIKHEQEVVFTFSQLDQLQKHNFTTNRGDDFSGFLLSDILKNYNYNELKLHSLDGGNLKLNKEDISNAYIIEMDDTDERNFRLIIPTDEFGQRWMKYLKSIELK